MKFLFGLQLPLHFHSLELKFDSGFWTNLALNPTTNPQFLPSYLPSIHQLSASGLSRLCSSHSHLKLGFDTFFQLLVAILWLNAAIVWWIINLKKDGGTPVSTRWLPTFEYTCGRWNWWFLGQCVTKGPSGVWPSFSKNSTHPDWCYVAFSTFNSFQMWLKLTCHPDFICLLGDSFIDLPNKQMVGRGEDRRKRGKEEMREEIILTLGCLYCDYLLKTRNKHFGSPCENSN